MQRYKEANVLLLYICRDVMSVSKERLEIKIKKCKRFTAVHPNKKLTILSSQNLSPYEKTFVPLFLRTFEPSKKNDQNSITLRYTQSY